MQKQGVKIWVDDVRPAPDGYVWCKSVNEAIDTFSVYVAAYIVGNDSHEVTLIDLDHDAGTFYSEGGDYIKFLDWLEANKETFGEYIPPIKIHSMNPVGRDNMRRIIQKNGWVEAF